MLLPTLNKAREKANAIDCANNLKHTGTVLTLYADDYKSAYPVVHGGTLASPEELDGEPHWFTPLIDEYGYQLTFLKCPSDLQHSEDDDIQSYIFNAKLTFGIPVTRVTNASGMIVLSERGDDDNGDPIEHQCYPAMTAPSNWSGRLDTVRHSERANYLFVDGHVDNLTFEETVGDESEEQNKHFSTDLLDSYNS